MSDGLQIIDVLEIAPPFALSPVVVPVEPVHPPIAAAAFLPGRVQVSSLYERSGVASLAARERFIWLSERDQIASLPKRVRTPAVDDRGPNLNG